MPEEPEKGRGRDHHRPATVPRALDLAERDGPPRKPKTALLKMKLTARKEGVGRPSLFARTAYSIMGHVAAAMRGPERQDRAGRQCSAYIRLRFW